MNKDCSRFWQLTDLLYWTARDVHGRRVGHIADVIVDPVEGRVAYLRIRMIQPENIAECVITVPWSTISRISGAQREIWIAAREATLWRIGSSRVHSGRPPGT